MLTYWVQEVNRRIAVNRGRKCIAFGFNYEDVLADKLYQTLLGLSLSNYPVREDRELAYLAPLYRVHKKLLDCMDIGNSLRNYGIRPRAVGHTRSALYFAAYLLAEHLPHLASHIVGGGPLPRSGRSVEEWLNTFR